MKAAHTIALIVHLFGLVIGLGCAALTDFVFVMCVRARRVGSTLILIMKYASNLVLFGYALLILSGIGLMSTGSHTSSKFWAKMFVVVIIGVNGTVAHQVIFPKLSHKVKYRVNEVTIGFLHRMSVVAAVSGVSWVTAMILGAWKTNSWPILLWVSMYLLATMTAVSVGLLLTPTVLKVDHPDFDNVFPILAPMSNRANMVWKTPQERARHRELTGFIGVEEPPETKE